MSVSHRNEQLIFTTVRTPFVAKLCNYFLQILTPVQMQFVGFTTSVTTPTSGKCVFAPIPGQDQTVLNTVRFYRFLAELSTV